jgi:hypothetical protein
MKRTNAVGWITGLALGLMAAPLMGQTTVQRAADVLNRPQTSPVVETRRTTTTTVVVPRREVIVVEKIRGRGAWWKQQGYRVVTVYYDGSHFYRQPLGRAALRKVVVYERGGRYYVDEKEWKRNHNDDFNRDHDRDGDRGHDNAQDKDHGQDHGRGHAYGHDDDHRDDHHDQGNHWW